MSLTEKNTSIRNAFLSIIISIVMMLVSASLMLFAYVSENRSQVFDNKQFEQVKQQLRESPDDQSLQWSVRELDRRMRNEYIFSRNLADNSRYLLVLSVLALVISSRVYVNLRIEPTVPENDACNCAQQRSRNYSAYGVLAVTALFALGSTVYIISDIASDKTQTAPVVKSISMDKLKENWHRFRGFAGSGVVPFANVPLEFDLQSRDNILWSVDNELNGFNSPIIFDDKVFFSGANEVLRKVYCLSLTDGKLLWSATVDVPDCSSEDIPDVMEDTGFAASSLATDGTYVYSIFANGDFVCHDYSGKQIWAKNLGLPESTYGFSASLDIWQGNVLVQFDHGYDDLEPVSVLYSVNGETGDIDWQIKRPVINSWTSPIIAQTGGKWQFITVSNPLAISYDPSTGSEFWRYGTLNGDTAPSAVVTPELTFLISPYESVKAVKTSLSGDISDTEPVWIGEEGIPDTTSPVTDGNKLWLLTADGTLTCYDVTDGSKLYEYSLSAFYYSSPTLAGDKMLFFSMEGKYTVLNVAGDEPEVAFEADFGEKVCSCPAFVDGKMLVRTDTKLYCFGKE